MLTITSPRNSATRVEVLGGALLLFDAGVAHVDGALTPRVEAAAKRRGYRIALERPPALEPAAPITGQAEAPVRVDQLAAPAGAPLLPPVPPPAGAVVAP